MLNGDESTLWLQGVSDHAMDGYLRALVASSDSDWELQHMGTQ